MNIPLINGCPAPGVYKNVPMREYASWEAANYSTLEPYGRSALHGWYEETHPRETTDAQALGSAAHSIILEPEQFEQDYVQVPSTLKRKVTEKAWINWQRANEGKLRLLKEEWDLVMGMRDAVYDHPTAAAILKAPGINEVGLVWQDFETGTLCKARIDRFTSLNGYSLIVDVKTARDARPLAMGKALYTLGYHRQGAWYIAGAARLDPRERKFVQIVVENEPPHAVAVYEIDGPSLEIGHAEVRVNFDRYLRAHAGSRPGYDAGMGLLSLPAWATKFHGEEA